MPITAKFRLPRKSCPTKSALFLLSSLKLSSEIGKMGLHHGGIMAATQVLNIHILADDATIEKACAGTLAHVYPGIRVTTTSKETEITRTPADMVMIDTSFLSKERLEALLNTLPDTPALLVVPDLNRAKTYRHLLSGRRELVAKGDLMDLPLIQAVHHLRERQQLHEQLKKAAHHLKDITIRDELTHLYNHHHFNEILDQETKKAGRYSRPLGLILVDIKNFAAINETHGHTEGDKILEKTANIIRAAIREVDIPARFGDNAFAIILPESDMIAAIRVGERLMEALSVVKNIHEETKITISIGISALSQGVETKEDILRAALAAVAESKKKGSICTGSDVRACGRELKENRQLIEQMHDQLMKIGKEAERTAFQSILKLINEIPFQKKQLVPHSERVSFYAERLAEKVGQANGTAHIIHRAGLLHDIGKLAIDAEILNKTTKLTHEEMEFLHQHPLFGSQIIDSVPFLSQEMEIVHSHHEHFDGKGYPEGRKNNEIPLGARIVAITEAWDTMISPQPYRPTPLSLDAALSELKKGAGSQFDPELVELFSSLITG